MRKAPWRFSVSAAAVAIAVVSPALGDVAAQSPSAATKATATRKTAKPWTAPRTAWGDPDLQGIWTFNSLTPLERPAALAGKVFLTEEEAAALEKRAADNRFVDSAPRQGDPGTYNRFWTGENSRIVPTRRTSLIVDPPDGRLPPLTPEAQRLRVGQNRLARLDTGPADSWLDRDSYERCIAREIPRTGGNNPGAQILQTPGYVTIFYEAMHDTRIIPLDGRPHVGQDIRLWNGDSIGHWDGATLVVDTTNFTDKQTFFGAPQGRMHLVERFTRVDKDTINYEVTVDNPTTWTRPWTFLLPWQNDPEYQELFEYACHEGNYNSMSDILSGARAQEKAAEDAATKGSPK
jgi:hypothetical protein